MGAYVMKTCFQTTTISRSVFVCLYVAWPRPRGIDLHGMEVRQACVITGEVAQRVESECDIHDNKT